MSETVSLGFELRSPIARVWQALTDAAILSTWTMFDCSEFRPVVGHRFRLHQRPSTGWDGVVEGEVLQVQAPHRLVYSWAVQINDHRTTVTWTLAEGEGGVTLLHLEQSGFAPEAKQEIGGAKYGWTRMLQQLADILAAA